MSSKKLVFLDIDGTLLLNGGPVSGKVAQALKQAYDNGHFLCICTGRAYSEVPEEMKRFDGVISAAGACVMWKDEILQAEYFAEEEKEYVTGLLEEAGATYIMEGFENLYMKRDIRERFFRELESAREEERMLLGFFYKTIPFDSVQEAKRVHKCSYFYAEKDSLWFRERLRAREMSVTSFSQAETRGNSGEITKTAFTKGTAVHYLSDYLGVPVEDTIAIGDSENDLEMLKAAGVGIAMGNASDYVKETADDVTESVAQDGVYHAFLKYGLISKDN